MRNHIAFKFIALLLCAATLALSLGCGAAVFVLGEMGLFSGSIEDMREDRLMLASEDLCRYFVTQYVWENLSDLPREAQVDLGLNHQLNHLLYSGYASIFQEGKYTYSIADDTGTVLAGEQQVPEKMKLFQGVWNVDYPVLVGAAQYPPEDVPNPTEITFPPENSIPDETTVEQQVYVAGQIPPEWMEYPNILVTLQDGTQVLYFYRYQNSPTYTVSLYYTDDAFPSYTAADWQLLEVAQKNSGNLLLGLFGSLLLFAIFFVYLCCSAGRKPGNDQVQPGGLNTLPLDLYALAVGLGCFGCGFCVYHGFYSLDRSHLGESFVPQVLLIAAAVFAACLLGVAWLYAFAAQVKVKNGYFWKHSVTGFCLISCLKLPGAIWRFSKQYLFPWLRSFFTWLGRAIVAVYNFLLGIVALLWGYFGRLCRTLWQKLRQALHWCTQALHRVYAMLPLTCQWLAVGVALVIVLIIAVASYYQTPAVFLLCVGISLGIIFYGAHAFGILLESVKRMSKGDLNTKVSTQFLTGSFREFAGDLNALADVAVVAAQKQMRSERMKTELITNVSHDIKTPLTSLINYVDLLQQPHSDEEEAQYLEVLERQSQRLKKLIEDLMEMSKASTGNLTVDIRQVDAVEAITQALGEFSDKLDAQGLIPVFHAPEKPVHIKADGRLTWRVLSNLLSNAVKYALPGTRLYVDLVQLDGKVLISLKNISREQLNVDAEELMERFVRGDSSRNTEGSGLGLNIARSLMEVQHGQLQLLIDGDLFKATLIFPGVEG